MKNQIKARQHYFRRIEPFIGKSLVKVITGHRRVGKSFFLLQLINEIQKNNAEARIIYINKEDMKYDFLQTGAALNSYILEKCSENQMNYIFVDEIQEITDFEKAIRSLLLKDNCDIYITGSNAQLLSGELATVLGGRTLEMEIHSLSYLEFLQFHSLADTDESLLKYMKFGGLPYLIHLPLEDAIVNEYLQNIYYSIIYRDVVRRHKIRNTDFLEQLLRFLADNIGNIFSASRISEFLKSQRVNISPTQIQTFTNRLCDAFIIHKVRRYDIQGKRHFETGEKYFFEDLGIRNVICGLSVGDYGKILENLVFNHLRFLGYSVSVGQHEKQEIDFIATRENEKIYLQVTLRLEKEETIQREFGNLLAIPDNYPKYLISMDSSFPNTYEGIHHLQIRDFLIKETL
jgi:uncharacterized protein